MSRRRRRNAALEYAPANDWSIGEATSPKSATQTPAWSESESPTRPLPVFRLEEEARRLDEEAAAASAAAVAATRCDEDATVTVSADDNRRLLASVFATAANDAPDAASAADADDADAAPVTKPSALGPHRNTDDEPTLDAPAPSSPEAFAIFSTARPVRVTARPPALKSLVITRPPPPRHREERTSTPAAAPAVPFSGVQLATAPVVARAAWEERAAEERRRSAATFTIRLPRRDMQTYLVAGIWAMALSLVAVLMFMVTSA